MYNINVVRKRQWDDSLIKRHYSNFKPSIEQGLLLQAEQ